MLLIALPIAEFDVFVTFDNKPSFAWVVAVFAAASVPDERLLDA